jgi:hypothetical protein
MIIQEQTNEQDKMSTSRYAFYPSSWDRTQVVGPCRQNMSTRLIRGEILRRRKTSRYGSWRIFLRKRLMIDI